MSLKTLLITYIIGGLTFPPLLIIGVLYILFKTLPIVEENGKDDDLSELDADDYEHLKMTAIEENETSGVKAYKAGWITVTREYHAFVSNANDKQLENTPTENKSAYTALYKLVKNSKKESAANESEATLSTSQSQNSNQNNNNNGNITQKVRRKNRYYGVLRHGNLFLYKDETQKDVQHAIVLSNNFVTIWPRSLNDGELFTKRSSICLLKKTERRVSDAPPKHSSASLFDDQDTESTFGALETGIILPKHRAFFIYCDTNYEKEDWYFELIKATKKPNFEPTGSELDRLEPSIYANPLHFKTSDMISLIQTLHSSEGQLHTRWLNAIIGRIFLSLQYTEFFENYVRTKLLKKLAKINKPGFLEEFKVKKIDVGNSAPFISFPKLDEIKPDGSLKVSFRFSYNGKLSMQVATKANLNLGARFKTREFTILLAVTINKIEGRMIASLKSPPSTRLWYTFESMPDIDLTVEPVVSQRQIKYSMITKVIENKLKDAIRDSLVAPAWDDINFYNTTDELYRGGIWDTKKRPEPDTHHADDEHLESESDLEEPDAELLDDVESVALNSDGGHTNDNNTGSDDGSIRSRALHTRTSYTSLDSASRRKSNASISTSNDQFLANGSYVSKTANEPSSPTKAEEKLSSRSSTMQIISEEASAGRKTITKSFKKIGQWYNEKNRGSSQTTVNKTPSYKPPEMISNRRTLSATSENPKSVSRAASIGDIASVSSNEASSPVQRAAPQPHTFPAEFMYGLETQAPDADAEPKQIPPTRIADMKSPYLNEGSFSQTDTPNQPPAIPPRKPLRRKPVSDEANVVINEDPFDRELSEQNEKAYVLEHNEEKVSVPSEPLENTTVTKEKDTGSLTAAKSPLPELPPRDISLDNADPAPSTIDTVDIATEETITVPATENLSSTPSKIPPPLPPRELSPELSPKSGQDQALETTATSEEQPTLN